MSGAIPLLPPAFIAWTMRDFPFMVGNEWRYTSTPPCLHRLDNERFSFYGWNEWSYTSNPPCLRPGSGVDHPHPTIAYVKERVELYICCPSGLSWPFQRVKSTFTPVCALERDCTRMLFLGRHDLNSRLDVAVTGHVLQHEQHF